MRPILYLHGFNSSPASAKAKQLAHYLASRDLLDWLYTPTLDNHPALALQQLEQLCEQLESPLLVGSSLGGYYATVLAERYHLPALLINPAVRPWFLLRRHLGWQRSYHSDQRWEFCTEHLLALEHMQVSAPAAGQRIQVWLQTGDETLDYRQAVDFYRQCQVDIMLGGDHSYSGFTQRLPDLLSLAQE